jgi:hypothetical protein
MDRGAFVNGKRVPRRTTIGQEARGYAGRTQAKAKRKAARSKPGRAWSWITSISGTSTGGDGMSLQFKPFCERYIGRKVEPSTWTIFGLASTGICPGCGAKVPLSATGKVRPHKPGPPKHRTYPDTKKPHRASYNNPPQVGWSFDDDGEMG